jgi:hypothetical protein
MEVPNSVVECLTMLLPDWNLGTEAGYPDLSFSWFLSVPQNERRDNTLKLGHNRLFSNPFKFTFHLSPFYSMLYRLSY